MAPEQCPTRDQGTMSGERPGERDATPVAAFVSLRDLVRLSRPEHWLKNVFVVAPLYFSGSVVQASAWWATLLATGCFCLWSSSTYSFNDVLDASADAQHPRKRNRPVPAGRVSPRGALTWSAGLALAALAVAYAGLPRPFLLLGAAYLGNSLIYCLFLKHRVIADVLSIAIGFVLRILAGCAAIGIAPSSWIVVCGFSLSMLLAFGKRRSELVQLPELGSYRAVLQSYSAPMLDTLLGTSSAICLLSYMLYTVAPETVKLHGTDKLVYSVPFVAYGVFRYILNVQEGRGDGPVEILTRDPAFALNGLAWLTAVGVLIYL